MKTIIYFLYWILFHEWMQVQYLDQIFNILILVSEETHGPLVSKYFEEFLFLDFKLYSIKALQIFVS